MAEFRSKRNYLTIGLRVGGITKEFRFQPRVDGGGYLITSDRATINAMKEHPWYGTWFSMFSDDVQPEVEEIEEVQDRKIPVPEVENISQAREYLKTSGVDYRRLRTPNSISSVADEMGVCFPNLK